MTTFAHAPHPSVDAASGAEDLVLGHVASLLRVHRTTMVRGDLSGGASLAWGARLEVVGSFRGAAHLSPGSTLEVRGSYDGERIGQDGTVLVSGRCRFDVAREPGTFVESGTVLVGSRQQCWTVADDGSLQALGPSRHDIVDARAARRVLRWSSRLGRFVAP